ncbi:MAG TPA: YraN family protein [Rudaea sp.]
MRSVGAQWENAALAHLLRAGLKPLDRNFSCRYGEIDIVARDHETVVFVEVRFRNDAAHGDGTASVGAAKREKLARTAQIWLQARPQLADAPCRFDVIGCSGTAQNARIEWVRGAFEVAEG